MSARDTNPTAGTLRPVAHTSAESGFAAPDNASALQCGPGNTQRTRPQDLNLHDGAQKAIDRIEGLSIRLLDHPPGSAVTPCRKPQPRSPVQDGRDKNKPV